MNDFLCFLINSNSVNLILMNTYKIQKVLCQPRIVQLIYTRISCNKQSLFSTVIVTVFLNYYISKNVLAILMHCFAISSVLMQRGNTRIRSLALGGKRRAPNGTPRTATMMSQDLEAKWLMEKEGKNLAKEERQM